MNPVLQSGLAWLAAQGEQAAITAVTLLIKDLQSGKSVQAAAQDLAMSTAEAQAKLLDDALAALGQ